MVIFTRLLLILAALVGGILPVMAEDVSPIYIVDVRKVIKESVIGKASVTNMETEKKKKQVVLERMKSEVDKMSEALEKQKSLLSRAALREKQDAVDKRVLEFRRLMQDTEGELAKNNQTEILKILDEVDVALKQIAKERPVSFVFDADPQIVVYASERVDLTEAVIKAIDERTMSLHSK